MGTTRAGDRGDCSSQWRVSSLARTRHHISLPLTPPCWQVWLRGPPTKPLASVPLWPLYTASAPSLLPWVTSNPSSLTSLSTGLPAPGPPQAAPGLCPVNQSSRHPRWTRRPHVLVSPVISSSTSCTVSVRPVGKETGFSPSGPQPGEFYPLKRAGVEGDATWLPHSPQLHLFARLDYRPSVRILGVVSPADTCLCSPWLP